ncbi:TPA: hypothetical protein NV714_005047 [Escherichia coli]|nr:hypothetical protein [Escherichia coli]
MGCACIFIISQFSFKKWFTRRTG